jgi:hypothetical protein
MHSGTAQIYSLLDRPAHVAAPYSMNTGRQRRKYGEVGVSKPVASNQPNNSLASALSSALEVILTTCLVKAVQRARRSAQKSP